MENLTYNSTEDECNAHTVSMLSWTAGEVCPSPTGHITSRHILYRGGCGLQDETQIEGAVIGLLTQHMRPFHDACQYTCGRERLTMRSGVYDTARVNGFNDWSSIMERNISLCLQV
jgi:hypothetical protein